MRSDEAILLFMSLNDLREGFGRAKIALWRTLSLDLHKMFLFLPVTISLAGFSRVLFRGLSVRSPAARVPLAGSSRSDLTGVHWDLSAAEDQVSYFGFVLLWMLWETQEVPTSLPIWCYGNLSQIIISVSSLSAPVIKPLAPHAPLLPLPREMGLRGVSWGNHGDNL